MPRVTHDPELRVSRPRPRNRDLDAPPAHRAGRASWHPFVADHAPDRSEERITRGPLRLASHRRAPGPRLCRPHDPDRAARTARRCIRRRGGRRSRHRCWCARALIPPAVAQAKAEQTRARLAPELRDLQSRHRNDPERLQRETMQLYRDENTSPFAGCLPVLIQAPIVGVLYAIFLHPTIAGHPNGLLTETALRRSARQQLAGAIAGGTADAATAVVLGGLVLLIAVVGELTRRLLRITAPRRTRLAGAAGARRAARSCCSSRPRWSRSSFRWRPGCICWSRCHGPWSSGSSCAGPTLLTRSAGQTISS